MAQAAAIVALSLQSQACACYVRYMRRCSLCPKGREHSGHFRMRASMLALTHSRQKR